MKRKIVGILILVVGLGLMVGIVYVMLFNQELADSIMNRFDQQEIILLPIENTKPAREIPADPVVKEKTIKVITVDDGDLADNIAPLAEAVNNISKYDLMRMAASFVERFGSYSNQSNFSNILDLKMFMSKRMKGWADIYIFENRDIGRQPDIYYGITTKAIGKEILTYDDDIGRASVLVHTRRREAVGSTNNASQVFSQDVTITFIMENSAWKIDSAFWHE